MGKYHQKCSFLKGFCIYLQVSALSLTSWVVASRILAVDWPLHWTPPLSCLFPQHGHRDARLLIWDWHACHAGKMAQRWNIQINTNTKRLCSSYLCQTSQCYFSIIWVSSSSILLKFLCCAVGCKNGVLSELWVSLHVAILNDQSAFVMWYWQIDWAVNIRKSWDFSEEGAQARLAAFLRDGKTYFRLHVLI